MMTEPVESLSPGNPGEFAAPDVAMIPAAAARDIRLGVSDWRVLCALGEGVVAGTWVRRSQVKIAEELSLARSTVQHALRRLAGFGWVEIRDGQGARGAFVPKWYRVVGGPSSAPPAPRGTIGGAPCP